MPREASPLLQKLRSAVESALEGKPEAVELALIALIGRGHVAGRGRARASARRRSPKALAHAVGGEYKTPSSSRATCSRATSSASASSISWTGEFTSSGRAPASCTNFLLADEINRASPRSPVGAARSDERGAGVDGRRDDAAARSLLRHRDARIPRDFAGDLSAPRVAARSRSWCGSRSATRRRKSRCASCSQGGESGSGEQGAAGARPGAARGAPAGGRDRVEVDASLAHYAHAVLATVDRTSTPSLSLGASPPTRG